jgi:hypothetical protein
MNVDKLVLLFAGCVVLASIALAHYVHPAWIWLTVFAGANLFQAGMTGFCPAAIVFRKLGAPSGQAFK